MLCTTLSTEVGICYRPFYKGAVWRGSAKEGIAAHSKPGGGTFEFGKQKRFIIFLPYLRVVFTKKDPEFPGISGQVRNSNPTPGSQIINAHHDRSQSEPTKWYNTEVSRVPSGFLMPSHDMMGLLDGKYVHRCMIFGAYPIVQDRRHPYGHQGRDSQWEEGESLRLGAGVSQSRRPLSQRALHTTWRTLLASNLSAQRFSTLFKHTTSFGFSKLLH
eukprot:sb/3469980/